MRYMICLILMVTSYSLQAGTIQKWVDEDGNVHYGDAPPASTKTENVRVQSAPSNPGKALPRLTTEAPKEETAKMSEEQTSAACDSARKDLDIINNNTRIRLTEADGNVRYREEDEIAQRKEVAQNDVERFCN